MAQIVKLRRSSVSGQKPTNTNLQLGELALNTTDGKVFMAVSGSGGPSVEELITTNTINTGSINLIGNINSNNLFISGSGSISNLNVTTALTASGLIYPTADNGEKSFIQTDGNGNLSLQYVDTLLEPIYNGEATQLVKGTPVYVSGSQGATSIVYAADASNPSKMPVIYIVNETISAGQTGTGILLGKIEGVNTTGYAPGTEVFVAAGGGWTSTRPTGSAIVQSLGIVTKEGNGGQGVVLNPGPSNLPNLTQNNIWVGDLNGYPVNKNLNSLGFTTTGSNSFIGNQTITGSVIITQDLTVLGSSSLVYVTSSQLAVSASFISVNVFEPAERFGGLKVYDSGSSNATASLAWDSLHNHWVYQNVSGAAYNGGMLLAGPRNTGSLGDEPTLTEYRILVSQGGDHVGDSAIIDSGSNVIIEKNTIITGSITVTNGINGVIDYSNITNKPTLVSGSSQIEITGTTGYSTFSSSISTSIGNLSSSIATTDLNQNNRLNSIETSTSSLNLFTSSYNTGSFSGSFIGDGSGLYNIPATGVTGLELDKIINGSVSASLEDGDFRVNTDTYIGGTLTAEDLYVNHITSSTIHSTGSNIFGAQLIDTHTFTGSVNISGSLSVNDSNVILSNQTSSMSVLSASYSNNTTSASYSLNSTSASHALNSDNSISSSYAQTASFADTFIVSGDITASNALFSGTITAKEFYVNYITSSVLYESGSTKFGDTLDDTHEFTGSVYIDGNLNVNSITGSIEFTNLVNVPTLVSSSTQISYTGITDTPLGIVSSSNQIIDFGFTTTGSFESFTSSYNTHSQSFDSRINDITGSIDSLNIFTSSVVLTSQTASMTVLSSSYALTASYALNAGGGGSEGRTARLDQTSASSTWTFTHNLGEKYPTVTIYDGNDNVVIPTTITAVDLNTITITFPSPQTGYAVATVGGGLPFISASFDGYVLAASGSAPIWKSGLISGSLQLSDLGYAITGSNTFVNSQTIQGALNLNSAQFNQVTVTGKTSGTHIITSVDTTLYEAAFFDYVIKDGSNMRAGTITSVWDGSSVSFNEVTTTDIGNTGPVTFSITLGSGVSELQTVISSGTWNFKVLSRAL